MILVKKSANGCDVMKDFSNVKFKWTFRDYQQAVLDNSPKHLKDKRIHVVAAPGISILISTQTADS
jgi:superfamily II DNA or RNA helicase